MSPPRRLAATLSRLDVRWWSSNTAVWQLLSFFSSCLESTPRGTNEKLAGEQKRSCHRRRNTEGQRCNVSFDMVPMEALRRPQVSVTSAPRGCRSAPTAAIRAWDHARGRSHRIPLKKEMSMWARKTTPAVPTQDAVLGVNRNPGDPGG